MFSSTLNSARRLKNLTGYVNNNNHLKCGKQFLHTLRFCSHNNCTSSTVKSSCIRERENILNMKKHVLIPVLLCRRVSHKTLPKAANIFGDLSTDSYLRIDMDEDEEEQEKFEETNAKLARWQKLSLGQYGSLIKSHINKRDLQSALEVLDLIKENRDKPTVYMYNLLIRAFAMQGNIKQCFKLFNDMKTRSLIPNAPTYNCLINACASSTDTHLALERLEYLKQLFFEKSIPLNDTHYNTLIKAYSLHNQLAQAFELADEMRDKRLPITSLTYACLLHAAVSDKKAGLRHAIMVWHLMRVRRIRPTIHHYNLLLRTMRDTKLGQLKVGDTLVPIATDTTIHISESDPPDLLAVPPLLSTLLLPLIGKPRGQLETNISDPATMVCTHLDEILASNRLILFGGYQKFLDRMKADNICPDVKTMTMIMELLPSSLQAETDFLKYATKHNIPLDIDFFNMLIKKRNMRRRYAEAIAVLNEMQMRQLTPNIMTFGVLALGCEHRNQGLELLEQMENNGFSPNEPIVGTLLYKGCVTKNFPYILDMMNYMLSANIKPSQKLFDVLQKFEAAVLSVIDKKHKYDHNKVKKLENKYARFKDQYKDLKEKLEGMTKRN